MNRIASLLAGTLTTALSGAVVAGIAASQGVFESTSSPAQAAATTAADESPVVAAATAATAATETPTESPQVITRIVYVDKEPIVYTQEVKVPASASTSSASTNEGNPAVPVATAVATSPALPEGAAKTRAEAPTVAPAAPVTPTASAPTGPSPAASPVAPAARVPSAAPNSSGTAGTGTGGREVHNEDRVAGTRDKHTEHEDDD